MKFQLWNPLQRQIDQFSHVSQAWLAIFFEISLKSFQLILYFNSINEYQNMTLSKHLVINAPLENIKNDSEENASTEDLERRGQGISVAPRM